MHWGRSASCFGQGMKGPPTLLLEQEPDVCRMTGANRLSLCGAPPTLAVVLCTVLSIARSTGPTLRSLARAPKWLIKYEVAPRRGRSQFEFRELSRCCRVITLL